MRSNRSARSQAELEELFCGAPAPEDDDLIGDHDGRILRRPWLAAAERFWLGKRFELAAGRLVGVNRLRLGGRVVQAARFAVRMLPSPFDGESRRTLVYPGGLVRDEIVTVDGGLLGRGFVGRGRLPIYFALHRSEG